MGIIELLEVKENVLAAGGYDALSLFYIYSSSFGRALISEPQKSGKECRIVVATSTKKLL
jgi:hypothetical protein